jgi:cell division protein FtsQ
MVFRSAAKPSKPGKSPKAPRSKAKPPEAPKQAKQAKQPKGASRPESPSFVDPRMQSRRIEVARGNGRRRLRWVIAGAAAALLVVGGYSLTQSPVLDVDRIEVGGTARTTRTEIREASGIAADAPMVSLDDGAVARRIEALPWVERATVTRSWPGTVRIRVTERTPVAIVGSGAAAVVVDDAGRALGPAGDLDLPVVGGDPVEAGDQLAAVPRWVVATIAELPDELRAEVAAASATPSGLRLTLVDDIEVRWGDASQGSAKADALGVLLEQADRATIATIDVSVPRAATVTRS